MQRPEAPFVLQRPHRAILAVAIAFSLVVHASIVLLGQGFNPAHNLQPISRPVLVAVELPPLPAPAMAATPLLAAPAQPAPVRPRAPKPKAVTVKPVETTVDAVPAPRIVAAAPILPEEALIPERPAAPDTPSPNPPEATKVEEPAVAQPPPQTRAFNPDALAERVDISYRATSSFVDAHGNYVFERDGARYEIRGELAAEGFFADAFVGKIVQHVEGTVSAEGLRPNSIANTTGSNPAERASIDWAARQLSFARGDKTRSEAMEGPAQDVISLLFSFAGGLPQGQSERYNIVTPRGQNSYALEVVGQEKLSLRIGMVETIHVRLTSANNRGVYEAWLAPDYKNLPVKLKFPAAQGRVVFDMVATRVKVG